MVKRAVEYLFVIMHVLSFTFNVLSLCGVWLPIKWESKKHLRLFYQLLSILSLCIIYVLILLQIILFTVSEFNINFLTDILFTLLSEISLSAKATNFVVRRRKIVKLADMLLLSYCLPRDSKEIHMEKDLNGFIRMFTIVLNGLAQGTLLCLLMTPIFQESHQRELPYQIWLPYGMSNRRNYWLIWACEIGPLIIGTLIHVTTDIIVSGFVLQACLQFDFLSHRLQRMLKLIQYPHQQKISKESIRNFEDRSINAAILHHDYIMKYVKEVTNTFDVIIIQQFIGSALLLSVIVYELSMGSITTLQKVMIVGYFLSMISELFSYCWFGNEITLKSIKFGDDIYKLDWTILSNKTKKKLTFIMLRASRPVVMRYRSLIILNIESFKSILKITYSVLNVLKESSTN